MEESEDDFKGFGKDFAGFPKRLPEDCVEYSIFVIDSKLKTQKEILAQVEIIRKESKILAEKLLKEYIWQREAFKLEVERKDGNVYLHGITNYGDSVEDEWLIVYILKELSNRFSNAWVRVVDTDGEFLLIEAANALPRWLNPEIADNRIWIHQNKLHIIPLTGAPVASTVKNTASSSRHLTLDEARETIKSTPQILIHSPLIEDEAFYRLRNYPAQIAASMHHSPILVPRKLAYILHELPASIAPAVESFYLRDPIALKLLQAPEADLAFPPTDLVVVSTRFTRILYAQLKSQEFSPPSLWKEKLLKVGKEALSELGSTPGNRLEIGMKVTCGFEMMTKDSKNRDSRVSREVNILLDDLFTDQSIMLPTDQDIAEWKDVDREDDESWLDINFEDFERELQGKSADRKSSKPLKNPDREESLGFGDSKTQADLKKMVERFEAFLNDDDAGVDGAELDEMDIDDDSTEDSDEDSEDEDKNVSFDENEFAKMMREMMGMPSEEADEEGSPPSDTGKIDRTIGDIDSDEASDVDEAAEMRKVMDRMEAELNEAGALNLDPTPSKPATLKGQSRATENHETEAWEDESDGEVNIDFNLAKNLLESFKSQAGMSGPGGNLMGMMGMQLPRDDDDVKSARKKE